MTREDYQIYKNEIQSKTTGANVHSVNGQLGLILNSISLLENFEPDQIELIERYTNLIPKCKIEINKLLNYNR